MCHPTRTSAADPPMTSPMAVSEEAAFVRIPDEVRPDLLDQIKGMPRPRRHALYALLLFEVAALFASPQPIADLRTLKRARVVRKDDKPPVDVLEDASRAKPTTSAGREEKSRRLREERERRTEILERLFAEGLTTKDAAAEAGCSYAIASQARLDWKGRMEKAKRDAEKAAKAQRAAAGLPDDDAAPAMTFDMANVHDVIRQLDATLPNGRIDMPDED